MKNIYTKLSTVVLILSATAAHSQVKVQSDVQSSIVNQNAFLDASSYTNYANNLGKGFNFPRTDLTTWEFITDQLGGFANFPTAFDGMVVYNTGTGTTIDDATKGGKKVAVEPGFYYFANPEADPNANFGAGETNIARGQWVRIGGNASTAGNTGADYKVDTAIPTGEYFWINDTTKKVVYRKMIEVNFPQKTYTNVTGKVDDNASFLRAQIIDKATGHVIVNSSEFKPNSGSEFGGVATDDYFVAKFGWMSTTLNGDYRMILEYFIP